MLGFRGCLFTGIGFGLRPSWAVETGACPGGVLHYRAVDVSVVDYCRIDAADGGVIAEGAADPFAAIITAAVISKPVVNPAIKAYRWSPIAIGKNVTPAAKSPVAGRPIPPNPRWRDPNARDPVVSVVAVGPVARCPDVALNGTKRLLVNRDGRRSDSDRNGDIGRGRS